MVGALGNDWDAEAERVQLDAMGQRGWELVAVVTKPLKTTPCTYYYFRREIREHDNAEAEDAVIFGKDKRK